MKLAPVLAVSVTAVCLQVFLVSSRARADEHERRGDERREIHMSTVEDDALDRCYEESGNDPSCFLATCSHF